MASLGSLVVSLAMDTARFQGDVGKAAQQMARLTAEAGKIGAAIGVAVGVGLKAIGSLVKESIDAADATSKLAQSLGMSTEQVSRFSWRLTAEKVLEVYREVAAAGRKQARRDTTSAAG